ncbi:DUF6069 family protein [Jiangella sp. DSM 45060]|uniref:DUF6069 family protein n=1 Tax=Jiangella sp. DSM 45060 TaxID=1798224 RepID=UPI0008798F71|nr:DUF6069 family protein [Jiangella sp. DSM 45060]SDT61166.1 hypothetical protein SAMN04515669_5102 [Jiangella sp. DSM 45060]
MTTQQTTTAVRGRQRGWQRAAWAVAGATAAAIVPWVVAAIAGADLEVTSVGVTMDVGPALVLAGALTMSLAGWGLLTWLLRRRGGDGRRVWTGVALTVLVLSLGGPLGAEADADVKVYLVLMHLAVGAVLIPGLRAAVRE